MNTGLMFVMIVTLVTWLGIAGYLFSLDRAIRGLERRNQEADDS